MMEEHPDMERHLVSVIDFLDTQHAQLLVKMDSDKLRLHIYVSSIVIELNYDRLALPFCSEAALLLVVKKVVHGLTPDVIMGVLKEGRKHG